MARVDSFSPYDALLASTPATDPWGHHLGEPPAYGPDYELLAQLLTIPVASGKGAASGALASGVDAWLSSEFRRAGFNADEVWPRPSIPRIMPREIAMLLEGLPAGLASQIRDRLQTMKAVGPADARYLGRAYEKQVDVSLSRWDRGPEMLLSTKTQVSSFGKNLANRFEEAYGDAGNLRTRYPLAAVGFFFVQRSTILESEPDAFEKTIDMMRKLRDPVGLNGYTATGLALVSWDVTQPGAGVRIELDHVPDDIRPEQFMMRMIEKILAATPVSQHVKPRELIERRVIPIAEEDVAPSK
ncbi:PaeR7I family type II restriction endonuclease [Agromyces sp. C10]|uniref:PaeR7I family type II restriction endonuclease n=1 Tax=Agromyces sp. C10 TaxID=2935077 RepID=UPI00200AD6AC|nr:PaeR7I family type II restriction endonuclease [Agromyces sp. C10]MCK8607905.1 PaeR7I family type II restriction endonuclease [Agromyces sp. C10]